MTTIFDKGRDLEGVINVDAVANDRLAALQAEVESLRVERDLFCKAAEAMLSSASESRGSGHRERSQRPESEES